MSFVNKIYRDGEWTFNTPEWYKNIELIEIDNKPTDFRENNKQFGPNEVGLKHPTNGSYIRITDDGSIELFSQYGTGIRIGSNNSIQFFGNNIQPISKEFEVETSANNKIQHTVYETYPKNKGLSLDTVQRLNQLGINTYESEGWK